MTETISAGLERSQAIRDMVLSDLKRHLAPYLEKNFLHNPDSPDADTIKESFRRECDGLNLGERYALSLSEEFSSLVKVAKLASTRHELPDESARLFGEYNDLKNWFEQNVGASEIERVHSDRQFAVKFMDDIAVVLRTRPLIVGQVQAERAPNKHETVNTIIYKETVFALPAAVVKEVISSLKNGIGSRAYPPLGEEQDSLLGGQFVVAEHLKQFLERELYPGDSSPESDSNGSSKKNGLVRIYTAYFSESTPVAD